MATVNKILGQSKPITATNTTLYTVPAATQANINIFVANQVATASTFRLAVTKSGSALDVKDYIAYDMNIDANSTLNFTGLALSSGDFITIHSGSGEISFNAIGIEIS